MNTQTQRPPTVTPSKGPTKVKMSKAQALALTQKLKNAVAVASVLCFGSLGGFLLGHTVTTSATTTATTQTTTSKATTTATATSSSSSQQGVSNFGSTTTSQSPVSGSSVS